MLVAHLTQPSLLSPPLSGLISDSGFGPLILYGLELLKTCLVALTILEQETKMDLIKLAMEMSGWKRGGGMRRQRKLAGKRSKRGEGVYAGHELAIVLHLVPHTRLSTYVEGMGG